MNIADGWEVERRGDTIEVTLFYPRIEDGRPTAVEVSLSDVRAADNVRITYDFERDGWVISQAQFFEWPIDDPVCDRGWVEVAFVEAWAKEVKGESG